MPAQTTRQTLARQWQLLKLLPSRGAGKTAGELAKELCAQGTKVSKRQVERDLWDLYEVFQIECNDGSTPFGWKWPRGSSVDLPAMGLAEALSMCLMQDAVSQMLPRALLESLAARFKLAREKITGLTAHHQTANWLSKVRNVLPMQPLLPANVVAEAQDAVHEALLLDRQVNVSYASASGGAPIEMLLHPLGLVNRGHVSYLIALAWNYEDVRLYAMHRVVNAEVSKDMVRRPEGFDIDAYLARGALHFGDEDTVELSMRVNEYLARVLSETPLSLDQKIEGDVVTAKLQNTWQLQWWILSQGDAAEVLGPASLRRSIGEQLQRASALYCGSTPRQKKGHGRE